MRAMVALMASLPLATLSEDVTTFYTIRDSDGADVDRALVKLSVKEKYKSALPYVKTSYVEHSSISDDHGRAQVPQHAAFQRTQAGGAAELREGGRAYVRHEGCGIAQDAAAS